MADAKRARCANLSTVEKHLLVDLCIKYKNVIENKKTDALSAKSKEEGWRRLAEEFCAECTSYRREWQQLKNVRITRLVLISVAKVS